MTPLLQAYIEATKAFYRVKAPQYLEANGVQNYMKYAELKLREEEQRGEKYLESFSGSLQNVSWWEWVSENRGNYLTLYPSFFYNVM